MDPSSQAAPAHSPIETFPGDTWDQRRKDFADPIKPHPMFPLDEDQPQETRRIYFITILRRSDENGIPERCPRRFSAEELREQGWSAIIHRYGRGWYRAEGTSSCYVKQAFADWQYFAGPDPRPFYDDPPAAPSSAPKTTAAPPAPAAAPTTTQPPAGLGQDWIMMLQVERERTERERERIERSLEAERERNQRLLEIMLAKSNTPPPAPPPPPPFPIKELLEVAKPAPIPLKELLEIAKGSQPQLTIKDMLEFARTMPQQGGFKELRENLDVLEALGFGRNSAPSADAEGAMAKDLISTVQSVISTVKTNVDSAPAAPAQEQAAPARPRVKMATVVVQGLGEVLVPEERLQGIMIAQQAISPAQPQAQAQAQTQPPTPPAPKGSAGNNGAPPESPPPASSPPSAPPPANDPLAALSAQVAELQSGLARITAFLVNVFGASPHPPTGTAQNAQPAEREPPPNPEPAQPIQGPADEAPTAEAPPLSVSAEIASAPEAQSEPSAAEAETFKTDAAEEAEAKEDEGEEESGEDEAETEEEAAQASAESEKKPIITPPPSMPSPDQIDQMLSMPEMLEILPPELRHQTEQIRDYYRSSVRSA